ncbi:hypothetical protein HOLleu_24876 [Holothuria leucospilota]|uniref:Uncharacterized protein n=1 Tax=Holothuria leucospilota TaxID=206669 RepID=A0A9Q1BS66_HOLLE|nr:hypothetical protein HOLleu_24876 [Holothuria leucospilota]
MLMRSEILLLMCCCVSLTLVWSKTDCRKMFHYRVLLSDNMNLSCTMRTTCSRGLWGRDRDEKVFLQDGCTDCGDRFAVTTNLPLGINILQVSNVSENEADIYYCACEYPRYKSNDTDKDIVACFNLTTYRRPDCRLSVGVNGKIFEFDGYYNEDTKKKINVTVNDRIWVDCSYGAKRKTNCSHLENNGVIVGSPSQYWCKFSCISFRSNMTCKIRFMVHSLPPNSLNSSHTSTQTQEIVSFTSWSTTTSKTSSRSTLQHFTNTKTTPFSMQDLFTAFPTEDKQSTEYQTSTLDAETSTSFYKNARLPYVTSATKVDIDLVTEASTSGFSHIYISSYTSLTTTTSVNVATPNDTTTSLIIISCVILLTSMISVLFCIHVFGFHMCDDKEEWVNPIYETADDIQLQGVIRISSNQYEDGGAVVMEACSAPRSVKTSTVNPNQINFNAESKGGGTVTSEVTLCDPMDTLGHGVTSFSEDFIESSKTGFLQDDNFQTAKDYNLETIGLSNLCLASTITGSASDRPTSPHCYEVVKQFEN